MSILIISAKQLTKKINGLSRINHYINQIQKELLLSSFITLISTIAPSFGWFAPRNLLKRLILSMKGLYGLF